MRMLTSKHSNSVCHIYIVHVNLWVNKSVPFTDKISWITFAVRWGHMLCLYVTFPRFHITRVMPFWTSWLILFKITLKTLRCMEKMKKQHFDISVGKLTISFIDAWYPGRISTLDTGLRDLFDVDLIHSVLRLVTFCTHLLNVRKDKYSTIGNL